jgi:hypothetical protein
MSKSLKTMVGTKLPGVPNTYGPTMLGTSTPNPIFSPQMLAAALRRQLVVPQAERYGEFNTEGEENAD